MSSDSSLIPPVGYLGHWFIAGLALFALICLWYALVGFMTRKRKPALTVAKQPISLDALKAHYLGRIDDIGERGRHGQLPPKACAQQLSVLVREFAQAASGIEAPMMTLEELRAGGQNRLGDAVEHFYPDEFASSTRTRPDSDPTVAQARELVLAWA
ncbi:hypothetical protein LWF01_11885 [Saxibacter everestensis]|uniref:DUF4381 domain-containing protein n=1 Tax=Saxibacter everestensis TaxID=2909229 RepID=A0ABY8QPD6_9MICO|nr:hypothetical protein LWF01_11885 [Brevibacteriaceae bacterium ZFBP1038]